MGRKWIKPTPLKNLETKMVQKCLLTYSHYNKRHNKKLKHLNLLNTIINFSKIYTYISEFKKWLMYYYDLTSYLINPEIL